MLDHLSTHRRRPWSPSKLSKSPPSPRDLEIYKRVRIWGHYQWEVAADLQVHYSRISQIVKRVEAWLAAGGSPTDPHLQDALAQRHLSRSLQKLRLSRAVEIASAALHADPQPTTKTRRRIVAGTEVWREEAEIAAPPINLYALQNYLAAVKALAAFEQNEERHSEEKRAAKPEQSSLPSTFRALVDLLSRLRIEAESAGRVDRSPDIYGLVVTTLQHLLGPHVNRPGTSTGAQVALNLSAASQNLSAPNLSTPKTSNNYEPRDDRQGPPT